MPKQNAFIIATDSTLNPGETLFLVDRNQDPDHFWSNRVDTGFRYRNSEAAEKRAKGLRHNNPRVLTEEQARRLEKRNRARTESRQLLAEWKRTQGVERIED